MKKRSLLVIIASAVTMFLTSCSTNIGNDLTQSFKQDTEPATIEITTSTGKAAIVNSINGAGYNRSGIQRAKDSCINLELEPEETATIHFQCEACGFDETETITAPYAKMWQCNCPEEIDADGNVREYVDIVVQQAQKEN